MRMLGDSRPGLNPERLLRLMEEAIERCHLQLDGLTVLTEAATGSYVVTPVIAAMAGARKVYAVTRETRYGTLEEVADGTGSLARRAGVAARVEVVARRTPQMTAETDIVTNSGHLRPLDRAAVAAMRPDAVIPLMYERWEYRPSDLDLEACRERGILVGGTNERHPAVDVFSFLGTMAVKQLLDAGVAVYSSRVLLLCDNPFLPYIARGLEGAGAEVTSAASAASFPDTTTFDAVVVAMQPRPGGASVVSAGDWQRLGAHSPGAVITQYWGDFDREAAEAAGLALWPAEAPAPGHMGVLPAAVGPEPTVRLQCGGWKAGEVMFKRLFERDRAAAEFVELM